MSRRKTVQSRPSTRKGRKNKNNVIILVLVILVIFGFGLYFLKSKSTVSTEELQHIEHKVTKPKVELPSPPEERWSYIKALETRTVVDKSGDQAIINSSKLTNEQKNILTQMSKEKPTKNVVRPSNQSQVIKNIESPVSRSQEIVSHNIDTVRVVDKETKGRYGLQCGAFKKYKQAESQKAKLAMLGFNARVISNGGWYRVFVGPLGNKLQAKDAMNRITNNVKCLIKEM